MPTRAAQLEDLEALLPLLRGYAEFYESEPSDQGLTAMATAAIQGPADFAFLLIAEEGESIAGFAHCQWKWSSLRGARIVVLDDLFVAEPFRGKGLGQELIEASAEVARNYGAPAMSWITAPDNHRAQKVYDRAGAGSETYLEYELELG